MLLSSVLTLSILLSCSILSQSSVFLGGPAADQVLGPARRRRANSFLLEEMLPGDLERECHEERCSQEEATEIFRTAEKTMEFWYKYTNLDPCQTNPCQNRGICTLDRGDFLCLCSPQYRGKTCSSEVSECRYRNGGCVQYCSDLPGGGGVQCGCADGYKLDADGYSCSQTAAFPCGRQQSHRSSPRSRSDRVPVSMETDLDLVNVTMETDSDLVNVTMETDATETEDDLPTVNHTSGRNGTGGGTPRIVGGSWTNWGGVPGRFCSAGLMVMVSVEELWSPIVGSSLLLTASGDCKSCDHRQRPDPGEQLIRVQQVFLHPHFHPFTFDSDIALLLLAQPVTRGNTAAPACLPDPHLSTYLLQAGTRGVVTGWGLTHHLGRSSRFLRKVTLPVVSYPECIASTEQVITDNMFCAGYLSVSQDACSGDSGGPFLVNYQGTWFLTGVVSWGEKCAAVGKFGVYTRLGNFLSWIRDTMGLRDTVDTPGFRDTVDTPGFRDTVDPPRVKDAVDTPGLRDTVDTPGFRDTVDPPGLRDTVDTPGLRDTVDTPRVRDAVDPPGLRDTGDTPGLRDTVDTPGLRDTLDTPGLRDTLDKPGFRDTVDTPGLRDTVDTPGFRDNVDTPGLRDTVDKPGFRDIVETPGLRDTVDTPGLRDTVETPGLRDTVDTPGLRDTLDLYV
ncbi:venom prothrombin activator nigrarin-D [Etheostoma spectabile]|uniref:venom prothrombin activator nigrarin-D n=1 Tax=Etheostoma spectabile TaxID=54343 RepID=UPI0013AF806A|nr:venom prothrombin activator nigrarin-D-like [Etheostoma spectabile]